MSVASLEFGSLNLTFLNVGNSQYAGSIYSTGMITGDNGLDISGNITGDTVSSTVLLNSTGNTNISGLGFFSLDGPIVCSATASTQLTMLFPFPSSSITQIMCTVGPINVASGGVMVSAGVIGPFSDINTTVKFLFYNPSPQTITISYCSIILYNPNSSGNIINIV